MHVQRMGFCGIDKMKLVFDFDWFGFISVNAAFLVDAAEFFLYKEIYVSRRDVTKYVVS